MASSVDELLRLWLNLIYHWTGFFARSTILHFGAKYWAWVLYSSEHVLTLWLILVRTKWLRFLRTELHDHYRLRFFIGFLIYKNIFIESSTLGLQLKHTFFSPSVILQSEHPFGHHQREAQRDPPDWGSHQQDPGLHPPEPRFFRQISKCRDPALDPSPYWKEEPILDQVRSLKGVVSVEFATSQVKFPI